MKIRSDIMVCIKHISFVILGYFFLLLFIMNSHALDVKYTLNISEIKKKDNSKQIKYQINNLPVGPTIVANKGDDLTIVVNNNTNISTIMHWHGLLVPNNMDGVSGVNMKPINPKETFVYRFKVMQSGTYWYHAHGLEEAEGIYGGIIFNSNQPKDNNLEDKLFIYSGSLDGNSTEVLKKLKVDDIHSNHGQSSNHDNHGGTKNKKNTGNSESKHKTMKNHFSDVSYGENLINGISKEVKLDNIKGEKIKLRLVNAYVDGYLNFIYSGGSFTIVAADGIDVKPLVVSNLMVAMGETYDIILPIDKTNSYELVAFLLGTKEYSKVIIGNNSNNNHSSLLSYDYDNYQRLSHYNKLESINYEWLNFDKYNSQVDYGLSLRGNHDDYNWSINQGKKKLDSLNIKSGDRVKIKITNHTNMPHPMHLHGYFFKVLNTKNPLIKHTYNLNHMESLEMEFVADEKGKWLYHCHNLFHMASGMSIVINVN